MVHVRFAWDPLLVALRRETCPGARWHRDDRAWSMTAAEADAFLAASHARLEFARLRGEIAIDGKVWVVGFAPGAPRSLE